MGGAVCSRETPVRIFIQGLNGAGKTSLLYRLTYGEVLHVVTPSSFYHFESFENGGLDFEAWDIAGRDRMRPLYHHYYQGNGGVIFVLDSADVNRFDDALDELRRIVLQLMERPVTRDMVVMVLANKQDLEKALSPQEIETRLQKYFQNLNLEMTISMFLMPCSVTSDDSQPIWTAFNHFLKMIKMKTEGKLSNGLIPLAWETANQDEGNESADNDVTVFHTLKNSLFKDPFTLIRSALFY